MRNKQIEITMNETRIKAVEKAFFKTLNSREYEEIKPALFVIYREICEGFGKKGGSNE